jgi:hypothetical protein
MKKNDEFPYKECEHCRDLGDCPHPEIAQDMMGSVLPPESCLKPMEIMKETLKKRKNARPVNRDT